MKPGNGKAAKPSTAEKRPHPLGRGGGKTVPSAKTGDKTDDKAGGKARPVGKSIAAVTEKKAGVLAGEKGMAIVATLNAIPKGYVTSYGEVAKRAGLPGYARFVCRVLRELPDRGKTPWWRVIRSDGRFAMGIEVGSGKTQYTRLKAEGLEIKGEKVLGPWW